MLYNNLRLDILLSLKIPIIKL